MDEYQIWGKSTPEIGKFYKFPKPIVASSNRSCKGKLGESTERNFKKGRLIKITPDSFVFKGHKIGNGKNNNKVYQFTLPKPTLVNIKLTTLHENEVSSWKNLTGEVEEERGCPLEQR